MQETILEYLGYDLEDSKLLSVYPLVQNLWQ